MESYFENETLIYCRSSSDEDDIGMGHVVRCGHLAKVLMDRGVSIRMITNVNGEGYDYLHRQGLWVEDPGDLDGYDFTADTLIVDLQENDDEFLVRVRPFVKKLVVVVGAGKTITERTHWVADMVVYQAPAMSGQVKGVPGERVLRGLEYMIIDPVYIDADCWEGMNLYDAVVYVGGGAPRDYAQELVGALNSLGLRVALQGGVHWKDSISQDLDNTRLFVGTMGMVVYEAMACGVRSVVVGRSEDHVDVASSLHSKGVICLGLAGDVTPHELATVAYKVVGKPFFSKYVDGFGAYRVAEEVLRL